MERKGTGKKGTAPRSLRGIDAHAHSQIICTLMRKVKNVRSFVRSINQSFINILADRQPVSS